MRYHPVLFNAGGNGLMLRLILIAGLVSHASWGMAATVNFNVPSTVNLPYSESGLTFSAMPSTAAMVVASSFTGDGDLVGGTNSVPIHTHVTSAQPFDLVSLDVENIFRTWRIESSSGAIVTPTGTGTINFTS